MISDSQIIDFWTWFKTNSDRLDSINHDNSLLAELDNIISGWGLSWEIGPGLKKENSLTISPGGTKSLLAQTNKIIAAAPLLDDWDFYSSKQAKTNWNKANLPSINFEFDASDWTYVLLVYPDSKIEILIKADNLNSIDPNTKEHAVDLIMTNLLGEERKMVEIDFIDVVEEFDSNKGVTKLHFLPNHLARIKNK